MDYFLIDGLYECKYFCIFSLHDPFKIVHELKDNENVLYFLFVYLKMKNRASQTKFLRFIVLRQTKIPLLLEMRIHKPSLIS